MSNNIDSKEERKLVIEQLFTFCQELDDAYKGDLMHCYFKEQKYMEFNKMISGIKDKGLSEDKQITSFTNVIRRAYFYDI